MRAKSSRSLVLLAVVAAIIAAVPVAFGASATHTAAVKDTQPGNIASGRKVYIQFCGKCHTLKAVGAKGTLGPNLDKDKINFNCVVSAVEQGVGGIQAEYVLRAVSFQQVYDVAKFVMSARQKGGTAGESCGIAS